MGRLNVPLHLNHDMSTYLVLFSAKCMFWNDPCRENVILTYMLTSLRNKKVNISLDLKRDM